MAFGGYFVWWVLLDEFLDAARIVEVLYDVECIVHFFDQSCLIKLVGFLLLQCDVVIVIVISCGAGVCQNDAVVVLFTGNGGPLSWVKSCTAVRAFHNSDTAPISTLFASLSAF